MNCSCFHIAVALALVLVPDFSLAAQSFKPRFLGARGDLLVRSRYHDRDQVGNFSSTSTTATTFRESFNFMTFWYAYHPRFFVFSLGGNVGLGQDNRENNGSKTHNNSSVEEYAFEGIFLPEHSYNLRVFYDREAPMLTSGYSAEEIRAQTRYGADVSYAKRPWLASMRYEDKTIESSKTSENSQLRGRLSYSTRELSVGNSFLHSIGSRGSYESRADELRGNMHFIRDIYENMLEWNVSERAFGGSLARRYMLDDALDIELPWSFALNLGATTDLERTYESLAGTQGVGVNNNNDFRVLLTHKLYESLFSRLNFTMGERSFVAGGSKAMRYLLGTRYTKELFWDGQLLLDIHTSRTDSESEVLDIDYEVQENFSQMVPDVSFSTGKPNIDPDSVRVLVLKKESDPTDDPASFVELGRGQFFSRSKADLSVEILVRKTTLKMLNDVDTSDARAYYYCRLFYKFIPGNRSAVVTDLDYQIDVYLKNKLFHWFYREENAEQEGKKGEFIREDQASKVFRQTWGVDLAKAPFSGGFSVAEDNAGKDRQRSWQVYTQFDYTRKLSESQYAYLTLRATNNTYTEKVVEGEERSPYEVRSFKSRLSYAAMLPYLSMKASTEGNWSSAPQFSERYNNTVQLSTVLPKVDVNLKYIGAYRYARLDNEDQLMFMKDPLTGETIARSQDELLNHSTSTVFDQQISLERVFPEWSFRTSFNGQYTVSDFADNDDSNQEDEWQVESKNTWRFGVTDLELRALYGVLNESSSIDMSNRETTRTEIYLDLRRQLMF